VDEEKLAEVDGRGEEGLEKREIEEVGGEVTWRMRVFGRDGVVESGEGRFSSMRGSVDFGGGRYSVGEEVEAEEDEEGGRPAETTEGVKEKALRSFGWRRPRLLTSLSWDIRGEENVSTERVRRSRNKREASPSSPSPPDRPLHPDPSSRHQQTRRASS
jgi:hypothetical protein